MSFSSNRSKPRWVILRQNEEARREAARADLRSRGAAHRIVEERGRNSAEFAAALAAFTARITELYTAPASDEALVAFFRAEGGRSAIRARVLAEVASAQIPTSELLGGTAAVSTFFNVLELQAIENRALNARQ